MKEFYLCFIIVLFVPHFICMYADDRNRNKTEKAANYFIKYGYLGTLSDKDSLGLMTASIKRFQFFANLQVTGFLDDATLLQMDQPRCGMEDPDLERLRQRKKRYAIIGYQWDFDKKVITWRVEGRGRRLTNEQTRHVMYQAVWIWEKHIDVKFQEVGNNSKADIIVKYQRSCHGDAALCFDGRNGIIGHAFYPYPGKEISGDIHFDDDEDYSVDGEPGTDLLWVAVHGLGHSLGLDHTNDKSAIMYPWYQGYRSDFELSDDDITGIQEMYSAPLNSKIQPQPSTPAPPPTDPPPQTTTQPTTQPSTTQPPQPTTQPTTQPSTTQSTTPRTTQSTRPTEPTQPPTTQPPRTKPPPKKGCPKRVDAMIRFPKYERWLFIFEGNKMYLASKNGIKIGPVPVRSYFPKIHKNIDAAVTRMQDGISLIFSGRVYYEYEAFTYVKGPLPLQNLGLPSYVHKIDAALSWRRNNKVYLFYDNHFWRFNYNDSKVEKNYPNFIKDAWTGIPDQVSAAITDFEGLTYFVKDDKHYLMNNRFVSVARGFPRYFGDEWMACRQNGIQPKARPHISQDVPWSVEP